MLRILLLLLIHIKLTTAIIDFIVVNVLGLLFMRVLFAVDSVFQLMVAVNLRLTIYASDKADIIIYDSTKNADNFCNRLSRMNVFDKCLFAKTPLTYCGNKYTLKEKLSKYFVYIKSLIDPEKYINGVLGRLAGKYDQFLFNGVGALPECIFNTCIKNNSSLICFRFEDSYLSYTQLYGSHKGMFRICLEGVFEVLFNRKNIENNIYGYYFMAPNMIQYNFPYNILCAPKLSRNNDQILNVLNEVFSCKNVINVYQEKYIFFECGDAFFFNNNDDLEYIKLLSEIVGGDNVLVKRHPRITQNRFKDLDVHVAKEVGVPWELIQMNVSLEDKVFITTKSAAALTSEVYYGDKCDVILLYKGIKGQQGEIGENFEKYISCFAERTKNRLWTPVDIDDFKVIINDIENK